MGRRGSCAGDRTPLLAPEQIVVFAWGPDQATAFEREVIERHAIEVVAVADVAADPHGAALRARQSIEQRCDRLLVHFDVDVIDFTDVPLSENWGRNEGSRSITPWERSRRSLRRHASVD
jgi:arginase